MKIQLMQITLTNFKGIRNFSTSFNDVTDIFGNNATGKTTLIDAYLWLLFGKDSTDRKDFEIKTLDDNNQPYHHLDHEVQAVFMINGIETVLRRSFREKWTKKRGAIKEEFSGHETGYFWNDVPLKQEEYQAKISELINENIFKLITNTTYFNSLKWQDRRAVLMQIAGTIDDLEVLDSIQGDISDEHNKAILAAIKQGKAKENFKEFRAELGAKKKKVKDELDMIPSRIQEANLAVPEAVDYSAIEENINTVNADIENVDGLLMNKSTAAKQHQENVTDMIKQQQAIKEKMLQAEYAIKNQHAQHRRDREQEMATAKNELRTKTDELNNTRRDYINAQNRSSQIKLEQDVLRNKWNAVNEEKLVFDENEFCCPACKRAFEQADVDNKKAELTNNFNASKSKKLAEITTKGQEFTKELNDVEVKMSNLKAKGETQGTEVTTLTNRIAELDEAHQRLLTNEEEAVMEAIASNNDIKLLQKNIDGLTEKINAPFQAEDNSALLSRKRELQLQIEDLKRSLSSKDVRDKQLVRIDDLKKQEATMAQELAGYEGIEFSIAKFNKAKMDILEGRINSRFTKVKFKMFETQINGGEIDACITLVNGVPYPDVNTAGKIQAGLEIINVLSSHYDVTAPVWVDNRESVVLLPETDCQLINLIVSEQDKKLRVAGTVKETAAA